MFQYSSLWNFHVQHSRALVIQRVYLKNIEIEDPIIKVVRDWPPVNRTETDSWHNDTSHSPVKNIESPKENNSGENLEAPFEGLGNTTSVGDM